MTKDFEQWIVYAWVFDEANALDCLALTAPEKQLPSKC